MTPQRITEIAIANGFKLKEQPDGSMALNPYVFGFVETIRSEPIDMVLYCPACHTQHIDRRNLREDRFDAPMGDEHPEDLANLSKACADYEAAWTNPPHRSHLCHVCACVWRPADVPTNGVAAVQTKGKVDSEMVQVAEDTSKLTVDREALRQVLQALSGHDHEIRELQVTRNLPIGPANPINTLIANYNEGL